MNENEIIDSGLLEQYVLGQLSSEQERQIEDVLRKSSDLRAKLAEIESDLERLAQENAIEPPAAVKSGLMNEIKTQDSPVISLNARKSY